MSEPGTQRFQSKLMSSSSSFFSLESPSWSDLVSVSMALANASTSATTRVIFFHELMMEFWIDFY